MIPSSIALYLSAQIRAIEGLATQQYGFTGEQLMESAGLAAFDVLKSDFPSAKKILIYSGSGNNAGDGYVLARLAHEAGLTVVVRRYKDPSSLPKAANSAATKAEAAGVSCVNADEPTDVQGIDLIVDALMGTGLKGSLSEAMCLAVKEINDFQGPVLSLDIPSGLEADTGVVMGAAVRAQTTITFVGRKLGLMTQDGPDHSGRVLCNDLGLQACLASISPAATILGPPALVSCLPKRPKNCHKNDFGHVLVIGGGLGMPGATCLVSMAALRVGAGLVSIATKPEYAHASLANLPEAMIHGIAKAEDLSPLLEKADVCVLGPGLGEDPWAVSLWQRVMQAQLPMVVDAQALRILAKTSIQGKDWILTPHPGEAASLLACTTQDINAHRYQSLGLLQAKYGGQVVLKGVGSLIRTDEGHTYLCKAGNAGMATAGMGDVLSGVIAGLRAQGLSMGDAAGLGVFLHAVAGDCAAEEKGERGLIAGDLMPYLRLMVNHAH